jgi:hypothetical protein
MFILYPGLLKATSLLKLKETNARSISLYSVILIFSITIFVQSRLYKPEVKNLFTLEKLFYQQDWEGVIKYQEKKQLRNVIAQYYYNIALAEKDMLCERMFYSRQDFGTKSILVQWDSNANINQIYRGAYFFYTIGLINEAHRWAFESMVMQGYRPENIKLLIKTEMINGHYKIAEKYINVLKKTLNYRGLAKKYEGMLNDHSLIVADRELGGKLNLLPDKDFLIQLKDQQDNVLLLLQANPANRKAYEYMMAWFMLERNVEKVCGEIARLKDLGYTRIPRHIEEAGIFLISNTGQSPDLGGLKISDETYRRFSRYKSAASQSGAGKEKFQKSFDNTFWYYMEF